MLINKSIWNDISQEKKDVSFRITPIKESDAENMIKELKIYSEIKSENIEILKKSLVKLSKFAKKHPHISELDINPLILNKKDAVIVDARAVIN